MLQDLLDDYWAHAGALVLLELIGPSESRPGLPKPIAMARLERIIAQPEPAWLEAPAERQVALSAPLQPGRRVLAVLLPVNMVPGVLLTHALDAETDEHELVTACLGALARHRDD